MPEALLPQLFEQQARLRPDAIALRFDGQSLSYAALNQRANRLAHHLRSLGVGPDARVGLCLERGVDMVVALLGVLKAAWRLHSARPGLSGGPHRLHGGRRRTGPGADRGRAGRAQLPGLTGRSWCSMAKPMRPPSRKLRRNTIRMPRLSGLAPKQPGLCDLHLRLDRPAERRDGRTRQSA
ncbi:AMP-binding protein [Massilia sp. H-1]|nr:AMP-binding protein [Massilia sp. H-1]